MLDVEPAGQRGHRKWPKSRNEAVVGAVLEAFAR